MIEIFSSGDPAEIAFLKSLLDGAGIKFFVFGENLTSQLPGGWGSGLTTCSFMVLDSEYEDACALLEDAGFDPYDDA